MSTKKLFFFLFLFFEYLLSSPIYVRIGIKENIKEFKISCDDRNQILLKTLDGKILSKIKANCKVLISRDARKINILNKYYSLPVKLHSKSEIIIDGKVYPGEIEIISNNNTLTLINILDIETYLYGVLPYEVVSSWNDEMLKVQAIIARTYTISNLGRHKNSGYDLCSTIHCQVYNGISKKMHQKAKKAVDSTLGLVIIDSKNNPIQAYYHAACGGATEDVSEIWGMSSLEYLVGVKCKYCKNSPYEKWEYKILKSDFLKLLKEKGYSFDRDIKKINILSYTRNGRVKELKIESDKSQLVIKSEELRKLLGYSNLRSTRITKIEIKENFVYFFGSGWGHGVGLCQWGAAYLASGGKKFDEIIKYYYPNTKIKKYIK